MPDELSDSLAMPTNTTIAYVLDEPEQAAAELEALRAFVLAYLAADEDRIGVRLPCYQMALDAAALFQK